MHGPDRRGAIALATALGTLIALAVMAGASWSATGSSSAKQYQYGTKVTICHHTHSKKHPQVTITVGQAAVKAHLKHGDTLGACTKTSTVKKTSTTTSSSTDASTHGSSHGNNGKAKGHSH